MDPLSLHLGVFAHESLLPKDQPQQTYPVELEELFQDAGKCFGVRCVPQRFYFQRPRRCTGESGHLHAFTQIYQLRKLPPNLRKTPRGTCGNFQALALVLAYRNKVYGVQSSGVLFIFWFLCCVCGIPQFRSEVRMAQSEAAMENHYEYVSYMIYYPLVVAMLLLNCFGEGEPTIYPYRSASVSQWR